MPMVQLFCSVVSDVQAIIWLISIAIFKASTNKGQVLPSITDGLIIASITNEHEKKIGTLLFFFTTIEAHKRERIAA